MGTFLLLFAVGFFTLFIWSFNRQCDNLPLFKLTWYLDAMEKDMLERMRVSGTIVTTDSSKVELWVGDLCFVVDHISDGGPIYTANSSKLYFRDERILISRSLSVLLAEELERKYYVKRREIAQKEQARVNKEQDIIKSKLKKSWVKRVGS